MKKSARLFEETTRTVGGSTGRVPLERVCGETCTIIVFIMCRLTPDRLQTCKSLADFSFFFERKVCSYSVLSDRVCHLKNLLQSDCTHLIVWSQSPDFLLKLCLFQSLPDAVVHAVVSQTFYAVSLQKYKSLADF